MPNRNDRSRQVAARLEQADAAPGLPVVVQTMGAYRLQVGDTIISTRSGMVFPLLVRLLYSPGFSAPRGQVLDALWPDEADARRNGNLRQLLYKLRLMGLDIVQVDELIRLSPAQVTPVFAVERSEARFIADVESGAQPFGEFLPAWQGPSPLYQEWLDQTRATVHADTRRILVEHLRAARERADWPVAERYARWLRQFDPLNEDAALVLAESTMLNGSKAEAVAMLDDYLEELGPDAKEIRLPAAQLKRRITTAHIPESTGIDGKPDGKPDCQLIGRTNEVQQLTLKLRRSRWNDGSATILWGPSGIGKTRILEEISRVGQIENAWQVWIYGQPSKRDFAFASWSDALHRLFDAPGSMGASPHNLEILRSLTTTDPTTDWQSSSSEGIANRETLRSIRINAFLDIISAVAEEHSVLLLIDDADCIDDDSLTLIERIIANLRTLKITILISLRDPDERSIHKFLDYPHVSLLPLESLTFESSVQLTRQLANNQITTLSDDGIMWIARSSEGNPFWIQALVANWIETGESSGVPKSIGSLLEGRLKALSTNAERILQSVCILKSHATIERIRSMLEIPFQSFLVALEELEASRCLRSSSGILVASHDLILHAAKNRLSPLMSEAFHQRVAEIFESEFVSTNELTYGTEAITHYADANQAASSIRFITEYAERLIQCGHPKALLLALCKIDQNKLQFRLRAELHNFLVRLQTDAGEYDKVYQSEVTETWQSPAVDRLSSSELEQFLSRVDSAYRANPLIDPNQLCRSLLEIAESPTVEVKQRIRATEIGLTIAANTCDSTMALACYSKLPTASGSKDEWHSLQRIELLYHSIFGNLEKGAAIAREMVQNFAYAPPSTILAQDLSRAGFALRLAGDFSLAVVALSESYSILIRLEAFRLAEYPAWQLAQIGIDRGDYSIAQHWHEELMRLTKLHQDSTSSNFANAHACRFAIYLKNTEEARYYLKKTIESQPRIPTIKSAAYVIGLELGVSLLDPHWHPPEAMLASALSRFEATSAFGTSDFLASCIIESLMRMERATEACSLLCTYLSTKRRETASLSTALARVAEDTRLSGLSLPVRQAVGFYAS